MRTNKWLIREFPEDLVQKTRFWRPRSVHFSTLNWELLPWSTPYLSGLAIEVNGGLYLTAFPSSTDWLWVLLGLPVACHRRLSSLSSQTKSSVNDLHFGQHSWLCPGKTMTHGTTNLACPNYSLPHGLILSKGNLLLCSVLVEFCHIICALDWYCQKAIYCLAQS